MFYKLLFICLFVIPSEAVYCKDSGLKILEPEHVSMEYVNFAQGGIADRYPAHLGVRDAYLYPIDEELTFGLQLNVDYTLIEYKKFKLFHRNNWGFDSVQSHVKHVWWEFDLGLNIYDKLEIFHQHMSRHILEDKRAGPFPVRDSFNVRLILWEAK